MLSTILWTRHDGRFTLSLSRITAVISGSCFVRVKACLISRRVMSYLRICTPPLLQAKLESILCQRLIQSRDKSMLILQIYLPPHPPLLMALLGPLHRYLHSRSCLPTVLSRLSITQHWSLARSTQCPSRLVSRCDALLPVITTIIEKSLEAGHFPKSWKEALVCPLLKKPGLHIILKNFRQVSNLAFLSKLTERALFHQMHEHMVDTNLYPNVRSAYRVHHSTETALLRSYILLNMNKQHVTLLVLLDLSAAFDTVEHKILLEALNTLGLGGRVSKWFRSYLSGRSQRILVRGCLSKFDLNCEVPQGSCLGPLLLWEFMWRYCYFSPKAAARVKSPSPAKEYWRSHNFRSMFVALI